MVLEIGGSNGSTSGPIKFKMAAACHLAKFQVAVFLQLVDGPIHSIFCSRVAFSGSVD